MNLQNTFRPGTSESFVISLNLLYQSTQVLLKLKVYGYLT